MSTDSSRDSFLHGSPQFATTRWSVVLAAGERGDAAKARWAMERLCQSYWYPLYAYARRRGLSGHDAQDLTQEFFTGLMDGRALAGIANVSRFRAFLLTAFKNFTANERDRQRAQKRGGGVRTIPLDAGDAESRYTIEPDGGASPEKLFERRWALALLDQVLERLENEYDQAGKRALFEALKPALTGGDTSYAAIAAQLNVKEGAIKVAAHRMRARYREVLRAEIAETVAHPDEIDDELRCLMQALSN